MSKIRFTLVALGIAAAVASVPAFALTGVEYTEPSVAAEHLTVSPGDEAAWKTTRGSAVVIVRKGALTVYDGRDRSYEPREYETGDVYLEGNGDDVVVGHNEGTTPLEFVVVHVDVDF